MSKNLFSNIRIVLVGTSHPGNIGAAARAMKTMGLSRLYLVSPKDFPCAEATARASGADDILSQAEVCSSLPEALQGCGMVIATTARTRALSWQVMEPREMARKVVDIAGEQDCALVFGHERSGLSNEELDLCQAAVMVPTNENYSSLNLAAAVQIISYEIRQAVLAIDEESHEPDQTPMASSDQMEGFYAHLEQTMIDIDFLNPDQPKFLLRRLRRLFNRTVMEESEVQMMRGLLSASQKVVWKLDGKLEKKK